MERRLRNRSLRITWGALLCALALAACSRAIPAPAAARDRVITSNVLRTDYAGSPSCAPCHADIWAAWSGSPMHQMTRLTTTAAIRAPFDGSRFHFKADEAVMETRDGQRTITVLSPRFGEKHFLVTKVIGGRYREDFAGVELPNQGPEQILPVTWVFATNSWRYKGYSTMNKERPYLAVGPVWRETCIFCHNTPPALSVLLDELHGPGAPIYQGTTGDAILPPPLRLAYRIEDPLALQRAVSDEAQLLQGSRPAAASALGETIRATQRHFDQQHLIEVGIGCEACHGGSREHVDNPSVLPSYVPTSPTFSVTTATGKPLARSEAINRVCARCHSVLFSRYPFAWEGATRASLEGGSHINSGEGRDFLLGACAGQLTCTACHDPHHEDDRAHLQQLGTVAGNRVCLSCHPVFAGEAALTAHSHHAPASAGSACLGCHLPRKNVGLDYGATRYHRIGSPTDPARVERDRPLECALCHTSKSVEQLTALMEQWWGKHYDRAALRALYGEDLDANVLLTTLAKGKPHEQLAAITALGEQPVPGTTELLAAQLSHPYPLVRFQARRSLEVASGRAVDLDLHLEPSELEPQVRKWLGSQ